MTALRHEVCLETGSRRGSPPVPGCIPVRQAPPLVLWGELVICPFWEKGGKMVLRAKEPFGAGVGAPLWSSRFPWGQAGSRQGPAAASNGTGATWKFSTDTSHQPACLRDWSGGGFGSQETRREGRVLSGHQRVHAQPEAVPAVPRTPAVQSPPHLCENCRV